LRVRTHGIGGIADLPIPLEGAVLGAAWALAISFAVLAFAWRTPRFTGDASGRDLPRVVTTVVDSPWTRGALRLASIAFTGYVAVAAFFGENAATNPTLGVFYVWLWIGMVALSLLFGRLWTVISPMRIIHLGLSRLMGAPPQEGLLRYPERLGYWPAALGLFAFVWLELVYPAAGAVSSVRTWCSVYAAVMLVGSAVYGTRWFERADPFEVYFSLIARLSPFGRRAGTGRIVVRNPLDNLDGVPAANGLVAVVAVLLGSTAFDSFSSSSYWLQRATTTPLTAAQLGTLVMLGFIAVVYGSFTLATMAVPGLTGAQRRELPNAMAHSVVPIIAGYVFAHYLSALVEYGQQTLIYLTDPLQRGDDLLGLAGAQVNYVLSTNPSALAAAKVGSVVAGHVLAVISAHDRAVRLLPQRHAVAGQVPLLAVMVGYTVAGLLLLFSA
jgi:hypothetical protein